MRMRTQRWLRKDASGREPHIIHVHVQIDAGEVQVPFAIDLDEFTGQSGLRSHVLCDAKLR